MYLCSWTHDYLFSLAEFRDDIGRETKGLAHEFRRRKCEPLKPTISAETKEHNYKSMLLYLGEADILETIYHVPNHERYSKPVTCWMETYPCRKFRGSEVSCYQYSQGNDLH